ncbi:MAG TPA: mechanosensitive ion channel domain-containing protein [Thermoanaerobaculia bacterium]
MSGLLASGREWLWSSGILIAAVLAALGIHRLLFSTLDRVTRRTRSVVDNSCVRHARRPVRLLLALGALGLSLPLTPLPPGIAAPAEHGLGLLLIAAVAWLSIALTGVADDVVASRFDVAAADNLAARQAMTRMQVFRRTIIVIVSLVAAALMLMTFPPIRRLGASLLASAGVAGILVGLAARETLSNLLAGLQIAFSEPIRLDDVVVVEGEWGHIEEIRMTYVVVRIWDERRLIVPLAHFLQRPFENWTRKKANLLGTVLVYADYGVPFDDVRRELHRVLRATDLWDGRVWNLQVTGASERAVELRALMSARDAPTAWDLRCYVREKLIEFLDRRHPRALPRLRAEVRREESRHGEERLLQEEATSSA